MPSSRVSQKEIPRKYYNKNLFRKATSYLVSIIDTSSSFDFTKRSPEDLGNHPPLVDRNLVISGAHAHTREKEKRAQKKLFLNALHDERISFLSIARLSTCLFEPSGWCRVRGCGRRDRGRAGLRVVFISPLIR